MLVLQFLFFLQFRTRQDADLGETHPPPAYSDAQIHRAVRDAWAAFEAMDDMHNQEAWR